MGEPEPRWPARLKVKLAFSPEPVGAVGMVGLRLGATLAAQVAAKKQQHVDRLVLWDPVVCGETYMQELWQAAPHGSHEIQGYPLTDDLSKELLGADLPASLAGFPGRTLVIVSGIGALDQRLRSLQTAHSPGSFAVEEIENAPAWHPESGLGVGAIPTGLVLRIVEWLSR